MICSDPRCLVCTPWERAQAGFDLPREWRALTPQRKRALLLHNPEGYFRAARNVRRRNRA